MNDLALIKQLSNLLRVGGPRLSLTLNTEARTETGAEEIALRWKELRREAADAGASAKVLETLDGVVAGAHRQGDGLVAFAQGDDIILRRYLRTPTDDSVAFGPLPHLLPFLEWTQENPRHIVLLIDRVGADIYVVHPDRETEHEVVEGDKPDIGRTSRGGWSQPRFQRGHSKAWRDNAQEVAEELQKITRSEDADIVLLAGDIEALTFLKENLPEQPDYIYRELDGSRQLRLQDLDEELHKAIGAWMGQSIEVLLDKFLEERGQRDLAVQGISLTLEALRKAQVDTVLVRSGGVDGKAFCSVADPSQGSRDRGELEAIDLADLIEAPATDVLVAAAIASGAGMKVIPDLSEKHGPREGVGGILRYT